MNRIRSLALRSLYILSLLILTAAPVRAEESPANLGQHTVMKGDTLYCLGRGYRVDPAAIAKANKLSRTARLIVGQVLTIPAVAWMKVPAGPVCATQFQSPYEGAGAPQAAPAADATPAPTEATPAPSATGQFSYTVQRGDTLFKIATRFHVTVAAIQKANNLTGTAIYVGQVLVIPGAAGDAGTPPPSTGNCDPAYPTICVPPPPPDLDCTDISFRNFEVRAPDPHRFDLDNDGIGCEG